MASAAVSSPPVASSSSSSSASHPKSGDGVEGNTVWVSVHKRLGFYADIAIRMFTQHSTVELHGLGAAIAATIEVGEHLIHLKRATLQSIHTDTVHSSRSPSKPKVVLVLDRLQLPPGEQHTEDEEQLIKITEDSMID